MLSLVPRCQGAARIAEDESVPPQHASIGIGEGGHVHTRAPLPTGSRSGVAPISRYPCGRLSSGREGTCPKDLVASLLSPPASVSLRNTRLAYQNIFEDVHSRKEARPNYTKFRLSVVT